ncbi:MAG: NADPH-dependent assimilatory sulfite reductase hemoprotein subunit [Pirellulales bacterium]
MSDSTADAPTTKSPTGGSPIAAKPSAVETAKLASNYLRGPIADELVDQNDFFGKASINLLKHHGTYQQDDRENRVKTEGGKSQKSYMFMVRTKIPGGKLTADQLLAELDLCDEIGNTTLRITTRQGLQLHGVVKQNLRRAIARINEVQLSTLAACGDVERNVMCCPAPHHHDPVHRQLQDLADAIAAHLCPRTNAYHEIWLRDVSTGEEATGEDTLVAGGANGQAASGKNSSGVANGDDVEPIYGKTYLPRKFKTAIGLPGDNCVDLYANDLGLMAICEDFQIVGYNVLVGGGFGVTPSAKKTFPAIAKRMAFCTADEAVDVATAIVKVFRDFGNRSDRKQARLKYLLHERGLPWFKAKVEEYLGHALADPRADDVHGFDDHLGWSDQGDGRWFYGLNVENGRIADIDDWRLKTALREICRELKPGIRLTSHQSILFTDIAAENRGRLEDMLRGHGVKLSDEISSVRRWSMACVAWPTCGLAITESERALPGIVDQFEVELARLGLSEETFTIRMTGCPNGCARPYNSDVGLVGKAQGKYTILLGGRLLGDRLNVLYQDLVPAEEVVPTLVPVLTYFKHERTAGETFGDFCHRKGVDELLRWSKQFQTQSAS